MIACKAAMAAASGHTRPPPRWCRALRPHGRERRGRCPRVNTPSRIQTTRSLVGCISVLTGYSTHTCVRTSVLVMYAIAMGRSSVPRSIATTVACEGVQADPPALLPVGIMLVGRHTQRRPRVFTAAGLGKAARRMPVPLTARLAACAALCRHMGGGCRCVAPTNLRGDVVAGRNVAGTST